MEFKFYLTEQRKQKHKESNKIGIKIRDLIK